jgi:hypothetical protein
MAGHTLADESTLVECGVKDSSAVLQLICVYGTMEVNTAMLQRNTTWAKPGTSIEGVEFNVTVKEIAPPGRRRRVGVTLETTVQVIKEELAVWSGIQPEKQMLLYHGRLLADDLTTSYYNLGNGAHIDLAAVGGAKASSRPLVARSRPAETLASSSSGKIAKRPNGVSNASSSQQEPLVESGSAAGAQPLEPASEREDDGSVQGLHDSSLDIAAAEPAENADGSGGESSEHVNEIVVGSKEHQIDVESA